MTPTDNNIQYVVTGAMEQADTPVDVPVSTASQVHQATIGAGTATEGTATLTARPVGAALFETVYDQDQIAIVYNCATSPAQMTFPNIKTRVAEFRWTLVGCNGALDYSFAGGE